MTEENGTLITTEEIEEEEYRHKIIEDDNEPLLPKNNHSKDKNYTDNTEIGQQRRTDDTNETNSGSIPPKDLDGDKQQVEVIDIDEFIIRGNECGRCQVWIVVQMMLVTFTLAYTPFIFYFIGFDPHWTRTGSDVVHFREDNARCFLNDSQWEYDYEKTTVVTEVKIYFH